MAPRRDLCLDFANTLAWRGSAPRESLHGLPDLVQWLASSGSLLAGAVEASGSWAERHPGRAVAIFRRAIALREATYRIFHTIVGGGAPAEKDLSELNQALKQTPARSTLQPIGAGFGWHVEGIRRVSVPALLAPVLWSAGDLLTGPQLARVRECANDKCQWLFLDESKNGTRRWCSMSACGNRAKAHRHYARLKSG
ncbi:MAG TPA: ABATE domain-containing protein [Candidatus Binataceae bacterium]|nr:ABATE domain-containing protein [Candidatus Binataceae bacterium]